MNIYVNDPIWQTILFGIALCGIFLLTLSEKKNYTPRSLTQELKGVAILAIVFAHIGYYLTTSPQFLFPFSVLAGAGVNLFLFLSGYGLTFSQMNKEGTILQFYKRRLLKLFIPFWIIVAVLFLCDYFFLGVVYPGEYMSKSFFGIFTSATMYADLNSPLWYFSFIFFYYLLFPLVFSKQYTWATALILYLVVWALVQINPIQLSGVIGLYQVHMIAFPLGVLIAWYGHTPRALLTATKHLYIRHERLLYPVGLFVLCVVIGYLALHGNVGAFAYIEEFTSIATMFAIILLFILKKSESNLLSVFGFFSYEIFLFHWPLVYRYDFLYTRAPAWLATLLYLGVFLLVALFFKKLTDYISQTRAA